MIRVLKIVLLAFISGPILWAILYAILYSLGGIGRLSDGWTLKHWENAVYGSSAIRSFAFSLLMTTLVLTGLLTLTIIPLLIRPSIRNSRSVFFAAIVVMSTPAIVIAQIFSNLFGTGGLLSRVTFHAGLLDSPNQFPVLVQDSYGAGMTLSMVMSLLPLTWLFFSQLWQSAQLDRYCNLAISLGASSWQAKTMVALPMLLSKGRAMIILAFILVLGSYEIPLLLGRQSPQMISVATQQLATKFDLTIKPQSYVLATLYLISVSLMLLLYLHGRRIHATRTS